MAEESARVAQRCEAAKGSRELILNECGLKKFPEAIFFLMKGVELEKVDLSHNQLQKITPKLGLKFVSITSLDLSHNKLTLLPDEFSNLSKLVIIDLSENEFESVPVVLRRIPMLTTIDLSSNKISNVHKEDYESMQCLEKVLLGNNPLREDVRSLLQSVVRIKYIT